MKPGFTAARHAVAPGGTTLAAALMLAAAFDPGPAAAQTIACAAAERPAEFAICNSETLRVLDEKVDAAFQASLEALGDRPRRQQFARRQGQWKIERDACEGNEDCLGQSYARRLDELSAARGPIAAFTRFAGGG
ncbi:MAG: hypothetical protein BroJett030_05010 [Alphaproteobacteria bacterium]|nr:MAG: hypothetical protein BroJett030_05010 [Alphaproteobacteria bacterium]